MAECKAFSTTRPKNDHDSVPVTFTVFPNLPMELQLRIWKLTIPGPRVIMVKVFAAHKIYDPDYILTLGKTFSPYLANHPAISHPGRMGVEMEKAIQGLVLTTDPKSPGLLFACKISRDFALKAYPKCFDLGRGRKTRFDPSRDTLLISHTCQEWFQPLPGMPGSPSTLPKYKDWFAEVTKLGMENSTLMALTRFTDFKLAWLLSQFPLLKTLTLVTNTRRHLVDLLETQKEVHLQTFEEAVAELRPAPSHVVISTQLRGMYESLAKSELDAFRSHNNCPAGWKCPEIETMYLGTKSV